jgi:hypothetical protein
MQKVSVEDVHTDGVVCERAEGAAPRILGEQQVPCASVLIS